MISVENLKKTMCKNTQHFIFCSCSMDSDSKENDEFLYYSWHLSQYLGPKSSLRRGKIMKDENDLGNELTLDHILNQLNSGIISFDFKYSPKERDSLRISIPHPTKRIQCFSVIFINNKWKAGSNNLFTSITKTLNRGKVKERLIDNQKNIPVDHWLILKQESIETIYDRLLNLKLSNDEQRELITEIVVRNPDLVYNKSHELEASFYNNDRLIGILGLIHLYYSGYKRTKIFSQFLDILYIEKNNNIVSLLLSTLQDDNEKMTERDIDFIYELDRSDDEIKLSLMDAFMDLDYEKAIRTFIELCSDENLSIQQSAIFNLGAIHTVNNQDIRDVLWSKCSNKNQELRYNAILGLASRQDKRVVDILLKELENIDNKGLTLLEAIEELEDSRFIPILKRKSLEIEEKSSIFKWINHTINHLEELR